MTLQQFVPSRPKGFTSMTTGPLPKDETVYRPGSKDAFDLPSVVNGQPQPRRVPLLMSSHVSANTRPEEF